MGPLLLFLADHRRLNVRVKVRKLPDICPPDSSPVRSPLVVRVEVEVRDEEEEILERVWTIAGRGCIIPTPDPSAVL